MQVSRTAGVLLLAGMLAGCSFGMTAAQYPPALGPRGVSLRLDVGQRQVSGELIEVRESGVVILTGGPERTPSPSATGGGASTLTRGQGRLEFVAYGAIRSSEIDKTDRSFALMERRAPAPDVREHLRLLSRFPQGLSADLLQALLTAHGQTDLPGVTP